MQVLIESTKFPSKALHDAGAMYSTQGQVSGFDLCVLKDRGPMGAVDKKEVPPLIIIFFNFSGGPDKNQYYNESFSLCSVFNQITRREGRLHYMNVINGHPTLMSCMHIQAVPKHKLQENAYICRWKPESLYRKLTLLV